MEQEPRIVCELTDVNDSDRFEEIGASRSSGIRIISEEYGRDADQVLAPDTGDFVKWLRASHPDLSVDLPSAHKLVLRSNDVWLPLVVLMQDVGLPVYLNIVSSYLYDRFKNALRNEKPTVHLTAEYIDEKSGVVKRFRFQGDQNALRVAIKKFDLNEFMNG